MIKPRIEPLNSPFLPEVAETLSKMMPPGEKPLKLFRTIAHHPRLLKRFSLMGGGVLNHSTLRPEDREIVIHRTCARSKAEYEWGVHVVRFARPLGFSEAEIAATINAGWEDPIWNDRQRLLVRFSDELHDSATVSDELWAALEQHWDKPQQIELLMLAGFYRMVSCLVNGARVSPEDGAERFPE